ncbi:hypothetical protein [Thermocoleostomius sinensis]|uniref:Uncharacterized protein n=1 Tax=Thermocoleostomius sinensis A174 TaxID=2016057 RepID=A0A9E9C969_9CYAN|nr:hypothetical protein [Thermocoleostomius sinensis]WAL62269.1 hypothetical protein OXH18_09850 [Thermocoleostomius sinensis A174]
MSHVKHTISSCRHCVFYEMQGRRGGHCRQLGVSVQGRWKVCSLASPPFASSWHQLERLVTLPAFEGQRPANHQSESLLLDDQRSDDGLQPTQLSFSSERLTLDRPAQLPCYELTQNESA